MLSCLFGTVVGLFFSSLALFSFASLCWRFSGCCGGCWLWLSCFWWLPTLLPLLLSLSLTMITGTNDLSDRAPTGSCVQSNPSRFLHFFPLVLSLSCSFVRALLFFFLLLPLPLLLPSCRLIRCCACFCFVAAAAAATGPLVCRSLCLCFCCLCCSLCLGLFVFWFFASPNIPTCSAAKSVG